MEIKIVLVGYPLKGNLLICSEEILNICINIQRAGYIPVAPQLFAIADRQNDDDQVRRVVSKNTQMCLRNRLVHELWMYGSEMTRDMIVAVRLAKKHRIPIVPKSEITRLIFIS